ncbi:hypothetical protein HYV12_03625 [Candidatus Dojkabacteria bacterium]|nr:hypothetical protein [Candidatus Dojkabacteria bacterium]
MSYQLGIYRKDRGRDYIGLMINGKKTVDIKLSTRRLPPFHKMKAGDTFLIKESSGPIVGVGKIEWVEYYEIEVGKEDLLEILLDIWEQVGLESEDHAVRMFQKTRHNRYITVFGLEKVVKLPNPVWIEKRDRRSWISDYKPSLDFNLLLKNEK